MACIYVLFSQKTNHFYTGSSKHDSAEQRLQAHNSGRTKSTKSGRPWVLVYEEQYPDYTSARKREVFLKSGQGRKWFMERWQSGRTRRS